MKGKRYLVDKPHNQGVEQADDLVRVKDLRDAARLILAEQKNDTNAGNMVLDTATLKTASDDNDKIKENLGRSLGATVAGGALSGSIKPVKKPIAKKTSLTVILNGNKNSLSQH